MSVSSRLWHPFMQHGLESLPVNIEKAAGAYLYTKGGQKILDGISSWWVNTHGHCHPTIVGAVQRQAAQLEQVIFSGFTHEPAEQLAANLLEFSGHHQTHVFFSDSGSTAVEVALKMAIGYWAQTDRPRVKILALEGGYHGDTFGGMSAGARSVFNKLYAPLLFDVIHLPFPAPGQESQCIDTLTDILKTDEDQIAAFIFEPLIQGASGMRIYTPHVLKRLADLCRAHGILLIADEVMTGFGRTGTKFACEQADVQADLVCLSKGLTGGFLPMGATLASADIYKAFYDTDRARMFYHSSSYTGNALACAAANANLAIWRVEPVQQRINDIGALNRKAVQKFRQHAGAENARSLGTIFAVDLKTDDAGYLSQHGSFLYDFFLQKDLLLRPLGHVIYSLPPYCVEASELQLVYDAIGAALDLLTAEKSFKTV